MEKLFNARWWDYSDKFMNINGRVYLLGYIVFGAGAVAILYLHPYLAELIAKLDGRNTIAIILAALFMLDIVSTNQSIARFNKILREYQNILKRGKIVQFFERNGRRFIQTINNRTRRIFTWQQRRILRAFPNFQTNYDKAFAELQKFYKKTKYKPAKTQKANARKKSKKILK